MVPSRARAAGSATPRPRPCSGVRAVLAVIFYGLAAQARADVDLAGSWGQKIHEDFQERVVGPAIGDYTGLPINRAARLRAESWDDGNWSVPEHQCEAAGADYAPHAPGSIRVWSEVDLKTQQLLAWHIVYLWHAPHRTIWMDDRPHPPAGALHTWMGFSTGKWVGDTLVVTTSHMKAGWLRRNGVPRSDRATLIEYWTRHGDYLTVVSVVEDPVYLTAPFVRSSTWALNTGYEIGGYSCSPKVESDLPSGFVAHHLPGTNPALQEFATRWGLSLAAAEGGESTLYPEFARQEMREQKTGAATTLRATSQYPTGVTKRRGSRAMVQSESGRGESSQSAIQTIRVRDNVFVLMSALGNTVVQVGDDGVLVIDPQGGRSGDGLLAAIRQLSTKPIRYVIDTSAAVGSSGGNENIANAGRSIGPDAAFLATETGGASIYAHENVLRAMSSARGSAARDPTAWPTDTYFTSFTDLFFNNEAIHILHHAAAYSDGDSSVYFRRSDVVVTGQIFSMSNYPRIDVGRGGSINGVIEALNRLVEVAVPERSEEGGTLVVPARGRLCDHYDLVAYRDMITIIRDVVRDMRHKGKSVDQVQLAKPTEPYDGRFGNDEGDWTTQQFVEAVFRSLPSGAGG
jgi:cyclase